MQNNILKIQDHRCWAKDYGQKFKGGGGGGHFAKISYFRKMATCVNLGIYVFGVFRVFLQEIRITLLKIELIIVTDPVAIVKWLP